MDHSDVCTCEDTKNKQTLNCTLLVVWGFFKIVFFKWEECMVCELYLNKTV